MRTLIVHGNPGIRKGAKIAYGGEEYVCFGINKQGEFHGPKKPQLWCTIGSEDERETYERREYIPMHLDVDSVDAEELEIVQAKM